jgi:hypothetical protein
VLLQIVQQILIVAKVLRLNVNVIGIAKLIFMACVLMAMLYRSARTVVQCKANVKLIPIVANANVRA